MDISIIIFAIILFLPGIIIPLFIYLLFSRIFKISRVKNAIITLVITTILLNSSAWIFHGLTGSVFSWGEITFIFPWTDCYDDFFTSSSDYSLEVSCKIINLWEIEATLLASGIIIVSLLIKLIKKLKTKIIA